MVARLPHVLLPGAHHVTGPAHGVHLRPLPAVDPQGVPPLPVLLLPHPVHRPTVHGAGGERVRLSLVSWRTYLDWFVIEDIDMADMEWKPGKPDMRERP